MNSEEIIEMARQAGFEIENGMFDAKVVCVDGVSITRDLETFAKLVAAKEREACAKLFDDRNTGTGFYEPHEPAEIIRARGEA
jgi:hypothetical protein